MDEIFTIGRDGLPEFDQCVEAVRQGDAARLTELLEAAEHRDALLATTVGDRGQTLLHLAAEADQAGVVRVLMRSGADASALDIGRLTPLDTAARYDSVLAAEALLDSGVDVNSADQEGRTALHLAISWRHPRMVRFLLEHGADAERIWRGTGNAYTLAQREGTRVFQDILEDYRRRASGA